MGLKLYVGNLSYQTTTDELRTLFAEQGEVTDAIVLTDRATGQSRGFGFVTMANDEQARQAMQVLNGKEVGGRTLTVNEARERQEGGGGGGGGGRGPRGPGGGGGGGSRGGRDRY